MFPLHVVRLTKLLYLDDRSPATDELQDENHQCNQKQNVDVRTQ